MCVIVMQPAGAELSGNKFRNCWSRNPDGGGFSYIGEDQKLTVHKGFFEMKQMLEEYRAARERNPNSPFLLHFRIATVGPVDSENTHPFWVRDDLVMCHNGTINGFGDNTRSDSYDFAQTVLASLPDGWEDDATMGWLVERAVGYNKIALLRSDGAVTLLNEKKGVWVGDLWFSNDSYKKVKYYGNRNAKPLTKTPVQLAVVEEDHVFLGQDCIMCDTKLDAWDCELAEEVQASVPLCYDCIGEHEESLVDQGLIAWMWETDPQPLGNDTLMDDEEYAKWLETNHFYST